MTESLAPASPDDVLRQISSGASIVVPLGNGEPVAVLDAIEAAGQAGMLDAVTIHQMHALRPRPHHRGEVDGLRHVSYFLSGVTRGPYAEGHLDFVPANFSEVPYLMRELDDPLVVAAASPPDRHGYVSLGTNADYVSSLIGRARFFVECTPNMPRTFGRNQLHLTQLAGWCESEMSLVAHPPAESTELDRTIGELVAERIPNRATIQVGIGAIPDAVVAALGDHRDLGVHTELLSDGLMDLLRSGVVNGVSKTLNRSKTVATFAFGSSDVYDFIHENTAVEMWPVRYVNNPSIIGQEPNFVSINATLQVDLLGQCASETLGHRYYSGSGGQSDFARGAMNSDGGQGFIVTHSTARKGTASSIVAAHAPGAVVTTIKNTVDHVVTEYGVARLRGRSVRERARALIDIAHPQFRDDLERSAIENGLLHEF